MSFVKVRKDVQTLNKEAFLSNFNISSVLDKNKKFAEDSKNQEKRTYKINKCYKEFLAENHETEFPFEDWAVQEVSCIGSKFSPECLLDFTPSIKLVDQIVYRRADDYNNLKIDDYFF